jgi:hypothetical protein
LFKIFFPLIEVLNPTRSRLLEKNFTCALVIFALGVCTLFHWSVSCSSWDLILCVGFQFMNARTLGY